MGLGPFVYTGLWAAVQKALKVPIFDTAETTMGLVSTSGSTGPPKIVDITHDTTTPMMGIVWTSGLGDFPAQTRSLLCLAPIYWYTAYIIHVQTAMFRALKVQTSAPLTPQHIYRIVNEYEVTSAPGERPLDAVTTRYFMHENMDPSLSARLYTTHNQRRLFASFHEKLCCP
ncbi:hypothetical protein EVAR_103379_1 [Eumeta japonica]|uniref:AMP-dependent synthetase/ligase domain-containing protein n=1 Tax=Eumeta variegata TaxID=151549 RepID=A0A4C1Y839_EUMVA|nr:hypothetical protein EVAR_103379_1 [Eumeta japonica]